MSKSSSIPTCYPQYPPPPYDNVKTSFSEHMRGSSTAKPDGSSHTSEMAEFTTERVADNDKDRFLKLSQTPHAIRYQLFTSIIKAASHYRASLNDMEELMLSSTRVLDNEITLLRAHGTITCLVGSRKTGWDLKVEYSHSTSTTRDPSGLHALHDTLDVVAQENASVTEAIEELNEVVDAQEPEFHMIKNPVGHLYAAAFLSIAVHAILALLSCGSMLGAYISAIGAMVISIAHIVLRRHNPSYARFLELSVILMMGLTAHDPRITVIGAATLVSALPGYMYICDYVKHGHEEPSIAVSKTVFWTVYAVLLGLGLHILLDVVLVYKLFTLVVLVQDTIGTSRGRRSTSAVSPQE